MNRFYSVLTVCFLLFPAGCNGLLHTPLLQTSASPAKGHTLQHSFAIHSSTPLYYQDDDHQDVAVNVQQRQHRSSQQYQPKPELETSSVSMSLINSIWFNQVTLLMLATSVALLASFSSDSGLDISTLHWNGMQEFHSLFDWQLSWFRMAEGVLLAIPMVAAGCALDNSDNPDASQVTVSTTNMVLSLFGRRQSTMEPAASAPSQVMILSAAIALSTGVSEEIIFRGYIPSAIASLTHSVPLALAGQAVLFACGHLSKNARPSENRLVGSLQLFNGLFQGMIYLVTGGDILPCIISHVLYDCHILCETWMTINNQMDWTQESSQVALANEEATAVKRLQEEAGELLNAETIDFARRFFFAFDSEHEGSLSRRDTQRALSYAFMNDKDAPDPQLVNDLFQQVQEFHRFAPSEASHDRISFSQFLRVLMVLRTNAVH